MSAPSISSYPIQRRGRVSGPGSVITRFVPAKLQSLGPRDFQGIAATDALCAQDNVALVMAGGDLTRIQGGPLSWDHKEPIGTITRASTTAHELLISASFPPLGVDDEIDRLCARVKAGVPMALSLQFVALTVEPINVQKLHLGVRATKWEALEVALCLVGADPGARITARKSRRQGVSMQSAITHLEQGLDEHRAFGRHAQEIADTTQRLDDHRSRLGTAMRSLQAAVQAGDHEAAADSHARCMRCLSGLQREMKAIGDRHQDAMDAVNGLGRALRSAGDVLDLGTQGEPTAGSTADTHGRSGRRSDLERLRRIGESHHAGSGTMSDLERLRQVGESY